VILSAFDRALADLGAEETVLVACSGGVDSVLLADLAVERLGARRVVIAHLDHAVRPGSEEDSAFVEDFAAKLRARFVRGRLPPGGSGEARLRTERYAFLEAERERAGARWVLTGHNRDDQAETVLLALIRSARASGLAGMSARSGTILRPLLDVPRAEIEGEARRRALIWREDPTNREPAYLRNRIRKELMPLLERRYRPGISARLAELAREMQHGPPVADAPNSAAEPRVGHVEVPDIVVERRPWRGGPIPDGKHIAAFDAHGLERAVVRRIRAGDRIRPFGMRGRRKVHDVLVDAKVPREARPWILVVATPEGEVVWVPGVLRSGLAPIGPSTEEVWFCEQLQPVTCGDEPERSL